MSEDTHEQNQDFTHRSKFAHAERASLDVCHQIGALNENMINASTAPFIASQILAREIERSYLEAYDEYLLPTASGADDVSRRDAGKLLEKLQKARTGDFKELKEFIGETQKEWEEMRWGYEPNDEPYKEYTLVAEKLRLLGDVMPENGSGAEIKIPPPAWMQKPTALKIQIEQFNQGGEQVE